jgi:putative peptidoglycan lipid II flippase
MNSEQTSSNRQIVRAAGVVMVGMALSSVIGLLTTMLVSRSFGTSAELDAFYAANRLTEILFTLMAGGALASAFIPAFTSFLTRNDKQGAWRLASSVGNLVFMALSIAAAISWVAAPWLVRHVLAPGFENSAQILLTISLLRIMLISAVIFGVSGLLMGILNAQQHFALPALAPAFYRLGWILGILFLVPTQGIHGLAWGVVLGAGLHLLVQLPGLIRHRGPYFPGLGLENPHVRRVGKLMAPRLFGTAVVQLNFLVNTIIASGQPEGSLTALSFALAIMIMPQAVIAQAIAIAALPTFSAMVAMGNLEQMRSSLANTLRGVLFLSLPASIGLILLRKPLIAFLLERGDFDSSSTDLVAWALLWFAAGLVGHSLLEIVTRAFYAMQDTRTPVFVGAAAMTLNVILSLLFSALFLRWGYPPHGGLALANSLATALECIILLWLIRKRLNGIDLGRVWPGIRAALLASAAMTFGLLIWMNFSAERANWLIVGVGIFSGMAIYWVVSMLMKAPEVKELPALILRRRR